MVLRSFRSAARTDVAPKDGKKVTVWLSLESTEVIGFGVQFVVAAAGASTAGLRVLGAVLACRLGTLPSRALDTKTGRDGVCATPFSTCGLCSTRRRSL